MRRCSGSRLSAGGGVIAPLGRHRPPSIWRRREPTVFEELITEWTPPNTEAALGAGWGGARVQGLAGSGTGRRGAASAGSLCHLHPLRRPPAPRAERRFAAVSGGRQRFAATTARCLKGPPRRPFLALKRGLSEPAWRCARSAPPVGCSSFALRCRGWMG